MRIYFDIEDIYIGKTFKNRHPFPSITGFGCQCSPVTRPR